MRLDGLFSQLLEAEEAEAIRLSREIELEWSKSGSPAMDLLLKRGTDAFEAGDTQAAIGHFTSLTDHAPEFAEGWFRRASAYAEAELYGPAVADLERTLTLEPKHYDAIATLGGIFVHIERPDMAMRAFEEVLAIHPHHPDVTEAMELLETQVDGAEL